MISHIFFILLLASALWCAIQISITDFRCRIIPDAYLFPLMLLGLVLIAFFGYPIGTQDAVIGASFGYGLSAIVGFIFDYIIRTKQPDAIAPIGMGDIKLIGIGGLWLGATGLAFALVIACISGGIWGRIRGEKYIPFAPFFLLGAILSLTAMTFLL